MEDQDSLKISMSKHKRLVYYDVSSQQLCGLEDEEANQAGRRPLLPAPVFFQPRLPLLIPPYSSSLLRIPDCLLTKDRRFSNITFATVPLSKAQGLWEAH